MAEGDQNPTSEGSWTDETGEVWRRKGKRGRVLEDRRIRSLIHREDVSLIVCQAFETIRYNDPPAKEVAAQELNHRAFGNVTCMRVSGWRKSGGCC